MSDQYNIQPGAIFATDFRIVRALTAGGMGAVYVAEQLSTGKNRALKVMLPALVADPALRKRFEQEARIGSLIQSEHVVEVVGAGVDQPTGLPWLAMELLEGEELARVVETRGALPIQDVLVIFEQLCHAVGAAHRVGVVHRDLKPENVFLAQAHRAGASYMVKVLDFGIAKIVAEASTRQTAAMGSPIWMAPEQADQSPITPGTDVWALGLIAFYLLTGRPFWRSANDDNATVPQVLKEVLFEPIVPAGARAAELGRGLPPSFDAWFSRCVAREPQTRFPDASHAGMALATALVGGAMPVSVLAPTGYAMGPVSSYAPGLTPPAANMNPMAVMRPPTPPAGVIPMSVNPATGPSAVAATGGSYTLPSQPAESPPAPIAPATRSAGLAVGAVAAFVLAGVVGGGLWWRQTTSAAATAAGLAASATPLGPTSAESGQDMAVVLEAKRLSEQGKYDTAHERLTALAAGSPARLSAEFKDVEFKWASETLLLADRTPDLVAKRGLLEVVAQSTTVDDTVRSSARDRLAALDAMALDAGVAKPKLSQLRGTGGNTPKVDGVSISRAQPDSPAPVTTLVPAAAPSVAPPPTRSVYDLANSSSSADWWTARRVLEPKAIAGTATVDELRTLVQLCRNLNDRPCVKTYYATLKSAGGKR